MRIYYCCLKCCLFCCRTADISIIFVFWGHMLVVVCVVLCSVWGSPQAAGTNTDAGTVPTAKEGGKERKTKKNNR